MNRTGALVFLGTGVLSPRNTQLDTADDADSDRRLVAWSADSS